MNAIAIVRTYETLYIVDPNATDEQLQTVIDKYCRLVTQAGGEVITAERWDKRRLAYEVKGQREGIYVLMYFSGEAAVVAELDRVMRISEDVIRHLITGEENEQAAAAKERTLRPAPAVEQTAPVAEQEAAAEEEAAPEETRAEEPAAAEEAETPAEDTAEEAAEEVPEAAETAEPAEEPAAEE